MRFITAVIALALGGVHVQSLAALPEDQGRAMVKQFCGNCHELKRIEEDQGTQAEWTTRIRRMVRRGAVIPSENILPLAEFLAETSPPRVRSQTNGPSPITTAVSEVSLRPIQTWIRGAGILQNDMNVVVATLHSTDAKLTKVGNRVRAFALSSRSSMIQGRVTQVVFDANETRVYVQFAQHGRIANESYLVEIITEQAARLSIPNEAIIEEGKQQRVYVQRPTGDYIPREIKTGMQGELYTEVVAGLAEGEQVVTLGSFFIDAEYKLKASATSSTEDGSLSIEYHSNDPPHEGNNAVAVLVKDDSGKPLSDAEVEVTYSMAAMPSMSMPEMHDVFSLPHQHDGKYAGDIRLSMAGTWQVAVTVTQDGKQIGKKELSVIVK